MIEVFDCDDRRKSMIRNDVESCLMNSDRNERKERKEDGMFERWFIGEMCRFLDRGQSASAKRPSFAQGRTTQWKAIKICRHDDFVKCFFGQVWKTMRSKDRELNEHWFNTTRFYQRGRLNWEEIRWIFVLAIARRKTFRRRTRSFHQIYSVENQRDIE